MNTCGWTVVAQVCGETIKFAEAANETEAWRKTRGMLLDLMLHGIFPSISVLDPNGAFRGSIVTEDIIPAENRKEEAVSC